MIQRKPMKRSRMPLKRSKLRSKARKPLKHTKRRKKGELTKLKEKLWQITRQIIIKRYGTTCYTCGNRNLVGSGLHVGHFIPSSVCSAELRFCLGNLKPQCYRCNIHLSGNWLAYEAHLLRDGVDVEELKRRNEATKGLTYSKEWFENKITEYQHILDNETP